MNETKKWLGENLISPLNFKEGPPIFLAPLDPPEDPAPVKDSPASTHWGSFSSKVSSSPSSPERPTASLSCSFFPLPPSPQRAPSEIEATSTGTQFSPTPCICS